MKTLQQLKDSFRAQLKEYPFSSKEEAAEGGIPQPRLTEIEEYTALDAPFSMQQTSTAETQEQEADSYKEEEDSSSEESTENGMFYGDLKFNVELFFKGKQIIEEGELHLPVCIKCGLVGRNGTGKTTLLKAIRKRKFGIPKTLKIHSIQQDYVSDETLIDFVGADGGKALRGLGFSTDQYERKIRDFSGGWRMRAQLARAIHADPDLLLLDEPTNFLDIEAITYLEKKVHEMKRVVVVSHDRRFLDNTVTRIFHLENKKIAMYNGNYSAFVKQREEMMEQRRREYEAQVAERMHLQAFVDRFRYNAKRAGSAQSKLKLLEKMKQVEAPRVEPRMFFDFRSRVARGVLLEMIGGSFSYGDRVVLEGVDLCINSSSRVVVVGANGQGKSTLLRILAGKLDVAGGRVVRSAGVVPGYFAQHHSDAFDQGALAVELVVRQIGGDRSTLEERSRAAMARFGLRVGNQRAGSLSGGQKSRLGFALMDALEPNLLLLDEPTNHLDMEMIDALAGALERFEGAVVCVSHDVEFIERVFREVWVCEGRKVRGFRGSISEYKASL